MAMALVVCESISEEGHKQSCTKRDGNKHSFCSKSKGYSN